MGEDRLTDGRDELFPTFIEASSQAQHSLEKGDRSFSDLSSVTGRLRPRPVESEPYFIRSTVGRYAHGEEADKAASAVPISLGFWTAWLPFALSQRWPFCWWIALAVDHFSRRIMGFAVFDQQPTSLAVRTFLGRAIRNAGAASGLSLRSATWRVGNICRSST